jgi:hypothetical protein
MTLVEYLRNPAAYDAEVDLVLGDSSVIETEAEAPKPVDMTEFAELSSSSDMEKKPKRSSSSSRASEPRIKVESRLPGHIEPPDEMTGLLDSIPEVSSSNDSGMF